MQQVQQQFSYCDKYRIIGKLGNGGQGKVKLGGFENQRFSIKLFKNDNTMLQEKEILEKLKHPNIIRMLDFKYQGQYKKKKMEQYYKDHLLFLNREKEENYIIIFLSSGSLPEQLC